MNSNKTDIEQAALAVEKSAEGARLRQKGGLSVYAEGSRFRRNKSKGIEVQQRLRAPDGLNPRQARIK